MALTTEPVQPDTLIMFAIRTTFILAILLICTAWNPDLLSNGLWWVIVPGLILICILDYVELGNAINR